MGLLWHGVILARSSDLPRTCILMMALGRYNNEDVGVKDRPLNP